MGKQTRRKKRGGGKKQQSPATSSSSAHSSALIQRIRAPNTDARTRHAALTGLASSLLLSQGTSKPNKKLYSADLLNAVRERVALDDDVECATAAAECLYFYVATTSEADSTITAGWTLVLLQRLEQCKSALQSSQEKENTKQQKQHQYWALTTSCLQTLCSLIETNPLALDRIQQAGESGRFIPLLLQLFILGRDELDKQASVAAAAAPEQHDDAVRDATILSVRTLHSALDDNFELLQPFLHASAATSTTCSTNDAWEWLLTQSCHHVNLPMPARLHAAGCLVVCRQLLLNCSGSNVHPWLDVLHGHVLNTAIPLLVQSCEFHTDIAKALLSRYAQAQKDYQEEQDDYEMERDVIKTVNDRKEPARLIARRQKLMKEQQNQGDEDMQQDDDTLPTRVNTQEVMERARAAWSESLQPLQLALEITANLTSIGGNTEDEPDDNQDMDMEWGPDEEAEFVAQQGGIDTQQQQLAPLDVALVDATITRGLPDRVLSCLKAVYTPLLTANDTSIPRDAMDDMSELQSKCAACLGNCLANLQSWKKNDCNIIWKELRAAKDQLALVTTEQSKTAQSEEALCNAMMLGIRLRSDLRKCIGANALEFMLAWLSSATSNDIKRDIVTMLGVLCCQEEHSAEVDRQVCSALLAALKSSKSAMLTSEILNSLMDMYGDDSHADIFDELNVLAQFQRMVPAFRSLIQIERHDASENDVEQWRETALNASRFISYKKGQL